MKLMSMIDFVLNRAKKLSQIEDWEKDRQKSLTEIFKYAKFLKQHLTLGMFVPCDEEGNVLEEPERWKDYLKYPNSFDGNKEWYKLYQYQQAKERVLFEGFEIVRSGKTINMNNNIFYVVSNGENEVTFHIGFYIFSKGVDFANTIEDLTHIQPTLTQTAINQIYK